MIFLHAYTHEEPRFIASSAQNLNPEKSQNVRKAEKKNGQKLMGDGRYVLDITAITQFLTVHNIHKIQLLILLRRCPETIITIVVISIAPYLTDKDEHTYRTLQDQQQQKSLSPIF